MNNVAKGLRAFARRGACTFLCAVSVSAAFTVGSLHRLFPAAALPVRAQSDAARLSATRDRPVTFNTDVAPIIFKHCASCHRPGEVAPFPLLSYQDAKKRAQLIVTVTQKRFMPPWKPELGYGEFQGVRRLTDAEIRTIQRWSDAGAPEGSGTPPPLPAFKTGWQLGRPDLVLQMTKPYDVPADGPEFYRCFVLPAALPEDRYISAFEVRPSNRKVVHHAIFVQDPRRAGRRLETESGKGYPCVGGFGFPVAESLGLWTAGILPKPEPEGAAVSFKKNSDVVLQLHFRPSGRPEQELCVIGLYFAKQAPRRILRNVSVGSYAIDIPAGESNYRVRSFAYIPFDAEVLSIFPHAHYLAREVEASAVLPSGSVVPLLSIKNWDFNWQEEYWYVSPPRLPQGTRVNMEIIYDNSANNISNPNQPPQRVTWGEQTTDEMGEVHLRLVPWASAHARSADRDNSPGGRLTGSSSSQPNSVRHSTLRDEANSPQATAQATVNGQTAISADSQAHNSSGLSYQQQGSLDDAVAEFRRALAIQPDFAEARNNLGLTLLAEGDTEGAVAEFRRALKTDPRYAGALNSLGVAFLEMSRWDDAVAEYHALLALNPGISEAYYNLGEGLKHLEDYDGAAGAFAKSLELNPGFVEAHCALGEVLWEQGKLDEAAKELQAAVAGDPDLMPAYLILANLLHQKGDLSGALEALQKVLQLAPRNGAAYQMLGIVLKQRGDIDRAAEAFRRAQIVKEQGETFQAASDAISTAALLRRQGDLRGSIQKLRFALSLIPNYALAHYQLGLALRQNHDDAGAVEEFGKAYQLDPRLRPPRGEG